MALKAFAILCGPASYTIDRNKAIFDKLGVKYAFMYSSSFSSSERIQQTMPIRGLAMVRYLMRTLKQNEVVLMSGYTGLVFITLFFLNTWYKKQIGIISDTQLRIPHNTVRRIGKWLWLNIVFRNKHIYGLAGGNFAHKDLFRYYGMSENRICLLPMMVNNEKYNMEYPLRDEKRYRFLYVGRLVECKGIGSLIEAFSKAFDSTDKAMLHIVGDGPIANELKRKAEGNRRIRFMGRLIEENLTEAYSRCHTLVLPSLYEPWGLVVNEAMSAGMSVIVSDAVGAHYDLVDNRETGYVFHANDVDDLAEKMRLLYENKDLSTKYANNTKSLMHNYWNYELYENCLIEFFNKCRK